MSCRSACFNFLNAYNLSNSGLVSKTTMNICVITSIKHHTRHMCWNFYFNKTENSNHFSWLLEKNNHWSSFYMHQRRHRVLLDDWRQSPDSKAGWLRTWILATTLITLCHITQPVGRIWVLGCGHLWVGHSLLAALTLANHNPNEGKERRE